MNEIRGEMIERGEQLGQNSFQYVCVTNTISKKSELVYVKTKSITRDRWFYFLINLSRFIKKNITTTKLFILILSIY